jgi:chorismate mutase
LPDAAALDRQGVRLVVNAGGHLESVARRLFPHAEITTTTDNTKLLAPVLGKSADAAISDSAEAHAHAASGLLAVGPLTSDRKALFVAAGAEPFGEWVDGWLRDRERDGFLPKLRARYLGAPKPSDAPLAAEGVFGDIQLRCELMPLVGAYKIAHGLPVEDTAQEARVLVHVATAAPRAGLQADPMQSLYRVLMASAKDIEQARAAEPNTLQPSLDELRAAIRGIDAQLLGELREALRGSPAIAWRSLIEQSVAVDGLSAARKAELGEALANVRLTP